MNLVPVPSKVRTGMAENLYVSVSHMSYSPLYCSSQETIVPLLWIKLKVWSLEKFNLRDLVIAEVGICFEKPKGLRTK
jgi:hypothetical protein